jgi:hypothetical protein
MGDALPTGSDRHSSVATLLARHRPRRTRRRSPAAAPYCRTAVEDHVLDPLAQPLGHLVVDLEGAGVDDAHVHASGDRVVQEHRVDRLAHGLLPRKENDTFDTPPDTSGAGQVCLIQRVASMKSSP